MLPRFILYRCSICEAIIEALGLFAAMTGLTPETSRLNNIITTAIRLFFFVYRCVRIFDN